MKGDLEFSTFQKRPAYRYIRESDHIPALGSDRGVAIIKLFDPGTRWTWYLSEYDAEERRAFGLVEGDYDRELGYIDMQELVEFRGRFGLPIERDLSWRPRPLAECAS